MRIRKKENKCWGTSKDNKKFIKDLEKSSAFSDFCLAHIELCFSIRFRCVCRFFSIQHTNFLWTCSSICLSIMLTKNFFLYTKYVSIWKNMKLNTWSGVETYIDILFRHYRALCETRKSGEKNRKEKLNIFWEWIFIYFIFLCCWFTKNSLFTLIFRVD